MIGRRLALSLAILAALAASLPAQGQDAAGQNTASPANKPEQQTKALPTITVTARMRVELTQNVPIAISVISSRDIETAGIQNAADVASFVPGFMMIPLFGSAGYNPVIRGMSTTIGSPNVGFFIDGVYMASRSGLDFMLGDNIERVEVARGPQYALYGQNSFAGAVNFITKRPTNKQKGSVTLGVGNHGERDARLVLSGPIQKDHYYYRVGVMGRDFNGFYRNNLTGGHLDWSQTRGGFLTLSGNPTDRLNGALNVLYERVRDGDFPQQFVLNNSGFFPRYNDLQQYVGNLPSITSGFAVTPGHFNRDNLITSFALHYDFGGAEFTSITAYNRLKLDQAYASNYAPQPIASAGTVGTLDEKSQEFRLVSQGERKVDWLFGSYLYHSNNDHTDTNRYIGAATPLGGLQSINAEMTKSWALFGQATYHITDRWDASLAMRYTDETKSADSSTINVLTNAVSPFAGSHSFRSFTPGAYLTYKPSDKTTLYASAVKAIKAGGFNVTTLNGAIAPNERYYGPENSMNYELGAKLSLLDDRLYLNADTYLIKWRNQIVRSLGQFGAVLNANAGSTTSKGVEADAEMRLSPEWTAKAGASYNDARYDHYYFGAIAALGGNPNLDGVRLQYAPRITTDLSLINNHPLAAGKTWFTRVDAFYHSSMAAIQTGTALIPPATQVNLHTGLRTPRWEFTLWMDNVFDNKAPPAAVFLTNPAMLFDFVTHQRAGVQAFQALVYAPNGRTFGVTAKLNF